jgi:hypothetical protein
MTTTPSDCITERHLTLFGTIVRWFAQYETSDVNDTRRDAAVCLVTLRAPWRVVGKLSPQLRQERQPGRGLEGCNANDEPKRAAVCH